MGKKIKITALYERLSRDDELQGDSFSIIHQKELLEEYSILHGFANTRHFTDDGISGTRFNRPGFMKMMEEVEAGNVSCICVKDLSRIGRDYLKVGQVMEMLRIKGVRLIAINDGVDTDQGEDEFMPFRNLLNEFYARDTSKKIKSVFQAKGRAGKHVTSNPPYGYLKDKDDPTKWVVDEEAAVIIRRIFQMTLDGMGPFQICTALEADKVEIPGYHQQRLGVGLFQNRKIENPFRWSSATVADILSRREYLGHTVNFKTSKHFRDSHSHYVDDEKWVVFENTQEPIIDQETFDLVQKIRENVKRWPNGWGPPHPLTGLVFCADCGSRLYLHRVNNNKPIPKFVCGNYPSKKCTSGHRIDADDLLHLVSQTLQAIKEYSDDSPDAFARMVQALAGNKLSEELRVKKHLLQERLNRRDELERLICRAYEEHTQGNLPDRRYEIINGQYETELASLEQEIPELETSIENFESGDANAQQFMELVKKYDSFENLDTAMCNELIEKILVHERDKKGSICSTQRVDIYFNFIGTFTPPLVEIDPEKEAAEAKAAEKEAARKEKLHQNYLKRKACGKQREYEERYKARRQERMAELKAELPPSPGVPISEYHAAKNTTESRPATVPDSVTSLYDDAVAV